MSVSKIKYFYLKRRLSIFILLIFFHGVMIGNPDSDPEYPKRKFILFEGEPYHGLYSNMTRLAEWIYIVKNDKNLGMIIDLKNFFGLEQNFIDLFFSPVNDPQIKFSRGRNPIFLKIRAFPGYPIFWNQGLFSIEKRRWVKKYPTDGLSSFEKTKWVYNQADSYLNPQIHTYRQRLNPLINQYLKPNPDLKRKIDSIVQSLKDPILGTTNQSHVIGIHLRMPDHFYKDSGELKFDENIYLDQVEKSIDDLIKDRDRNSIKLFVCTINQPVLDRLSLKYHVVASDIPRSSQMNGDWSELLSGSDHYLNAEGALVDAYVLSQCDQFFCGPSNLAMFVACLNSDLDTVLLPCFKGWKSR